MNQLKQYGLLTVLLLAGLGARGQKHQAPAVVGVAGQAFAAHGLLLDWTVGEMAIGTWQPLGQPQMLEGFHRGLWTPLAFSAVEVYPNPFKSDVWVRVPETAEKVTLEIYDLQGQKVRAVHATPKLGNVRLELGDLPMAGYMLRVYEPASQRRTTHLLLKND